MNPYESPLEYKYTDQEFDDKTNLYNYNARLYDPETGMFISADSIVSRPGDPQMLNRYSYVRNNPLMFTDPSGHEFIPFTVRCSKAGCGGHGGNFETAGGATTYVTTDDNGNETGSHTTFHGVTDNYAKRHPKAAKQYNDTAAAMAAFSNQIYRSLVFNAMIGRNSMGGGSYDGTISAGPGGVIDNYGLGQVDGQKAFFYHYYDGFKEGINPTTKLI